MQLFTENLPEVLIAAGILAIAIEAGILGFATLYLFFIGMATLLTGTAMNFGLLDTSWTSALISVGLGSVLLTILAWKPMRQLQADAQQPGQSSDLIGLTFRLTSELSTETLSAYRYSGILWSVKPAIKLTTPLPEGTEVVVTAVEVGGFYVEPAGITNNPE